MNDFFYSSHFYYASESRKFLSSISFSLLKVETTTPAKRLSKKKFERMIMKMKNNDQYMFSLVLGCMSIPTESIPLFMMSIHPSVVES